MFSKLPSFLFIFHLWQLVWEWPRKWVCAVQSASIQTQLSVRIHNKEWFSSEQHSGKRKRKCCSGIILQKERKVEKRPLISLSSFLVDVSTCLFFPSGSLPLSGQCFWISWVDIGQGKDFENHWLASIGSWTRNICMVWTLTAQWFSPLETSMIKNPATVKKGEENVNAGFLEVSFFYENHVTRDTISHPRHYKWFSKTSSCTCANLWTP